MGQIINQTYNFSYNYANRNASNEFSFKQLIGIINTIIYNIINKY